MISINSSVVLSWMLYLIAFQIYSWSISLSFLVGIQILLDYTFFAALGFSALKPHQEGSISGVGDNWAPSPVSQRPVLWEAGGACLVSQLSGALYHLMWSFIISIDVPIFSNQKLLHSFCSLFKPGLLPSVPDSWDLFRSMQYNTSFMVHVPYHIQKRPFSTITSLVYGMSVLLWTQVFLGILAIINKSVLCYSSAHLLVRQVDINK